MSPMTWAVRRRVAGGGPPRVAPVAIATPITTAQRRPHPASVSTPMG